MKNNIIRICIASLAIVLGACLDDGKYALDPSETNNVIEFLDNSGPTNPAGAVYPVWTSVTEIVPEFSFEQTLSFSGPNDNSEDIVLTLAIDPIAVEEYNTQRIEEDGNANNTYNVMPADYFSFDDFTVTIPKGQTKANISITVFPEKFDLTKSFVLPLRIVSASSGILSAHFSTALLAVVVKNKYDGIYKILDGQVTRLVAGVPDAALAGQYNEGLEVELATINGNTNGVVLLWKDGSDIGGIGGTQVQFDETSTPVKLTWTATGNATLKNFPATVNEYDPDTRTLISSITWSTPGTREVNNLKIKWDRPRP